MRPESWRLGVNLGMNYNMAGLGFQDLSPQGGDFIKLIINDGSGAAPYFGIMGEYLSDQWWGLQLRLSYDARHAVVYDETYDHRPKFDISNSYLTIEPLFRINQAELSGFNWTLGPILAIKMQGDLVFSPTENGPEQDMGEIEGLTAFTYGLQTGFAYDFLVGNSGNDKRWFITPFIDLSWLVNQKSSDFPDQNSFDDIWSTVTLRAGARASLEFLPDMAMTAPEENDNLIVTLPLNGIVKSRIVKEYLPLAPYVFFDAGNQEIPNRYIRLSSSEGADFSENSFRDVTNEEVMKKKRQQEQMFVYYNIMNIYGDRMRKNPADKLELVGSAPVEKDGEVLAGKVRDYMVNSMGIDPARITVKGQEMPRIPSGSANTPAEDRPLTDAENRRVEFVFANMKFYDPVEVLLFDESPVDNDIMVDIDDDVKFRNWSISISGDGQDRLYGPFVNDVEYINPTSILGDKQEGEYTGNIIINTEDGGTITEKTDFVLKREIVQEEIGKRFSILFNYGQKDAIKNSESTIRTIMVPQIDKGNNVIIHGHTDVVGGTQLNRQLSRDRAKEAKSVFDSEFAKTGKKINTQAIGYGESKTASSFDNALPEGRMFNRNVMIDIVPIRK